MINTIEELLEVKPKSIKNVFDTEEWGHANGSWVVGHGGSHIEELENILDSTFFVEILQNKKCDRTKVHILEDHKFDGRRVWRLGIIYFDNVPFMVVQNAGREGDDYRERFIIDRPTYLSFLRDLIEYIAKSDDLFCKEMTEGIVETDIYSEIKNLTEFYNDSLTNANKERW